MSVANARAEFGVVLTEALPDFTVFPNVNDFHESEKPTLLFVRERVERFADAPQAYRTNTFVLYVIAPANSDEDDLDGYLDEVLDVLLSIRGLKWTSAERGSFAEHAAYLISITQTSTHTQEAS